MSDKKEIGAPDAWAPPAYITAKDSPEALRALSEQRVSTSYSKAISALRNYEKDRDNLLLLNVAISALVDHRAVMESKATK